MKVLAATLTLLLCLCGLAVADGAVPIDQQWQDAGPAAGAPPAIPAPSPVATPAQNDTEAVGITLTGGSLKAGKASVQAQVANGGERALLGVRIGAYYDAIDALPAPDARWRLHEFVLEPPLAPGAKADLQFTDDDGAEYILLRVVYGRFALAISVGGAAARPAGQELLERNGVQYIAARDLAAALGMQLEPVPVPAPTSAATPTPPSATPPPAVPAPASPIMLRRPAAGAQPALSLLFTVGSSAVKLSGKPQTLAHPVVEQAGRSYLPLAETCTLLGYDADYDLGANLLSLIPRP